MTTTLSTTTACYALAGSPTTACAKKKRSISDDPISGKGSKRPKSWRCSANCCGTLPMEMISSSMHDHVLKKVLFQKKIQNLPKFSTAEEYFADLVLPSSVHRGADPSVPVPDPLESVQDPLNAKTDATSSNVGLNQVDLEIFLFALFVAGT